MTWNLGHLDVTEYLMEKGAQAHINDKDNDGKTALHHSCTEGNLEILYFVIPKLNDENESKWHLGRLQITKYLVEKGANVNAEDNDGNTALHYSNQRGNWNYWFLNNERIKMNLFVTEHWDVSKYLTDTKAKIK